jgi:hypothetical protein
MEGFKLLSIMPSHFCLYKVEVSGDIIKHGGKLHYHSRRDKEPIS